MKRTMWCALAIAVGGCNEAQVHDGVVTYDAGAPDASDDGVYMECQLAYETGHAGDYCNFYDDHSSACFLPPRTVANSGDLYSEVFCGIDQELLVWDEQRVEPNPDHEIGLPYRSGTACITYREASEAGPLSYASLICVRDEYLPPASGGVPIDFDGPEACDARIGDLQVGAACTGDTICAVEARVRTDRIDPATGDPGCREEVLFVWCGDDRVRAIAPLFSPPICPGARDPLGCDGRACAF